MEKRSPIGNRRLVGSDGRGPAVDSSGGPVIDPSKNVLDLVEAAIKRIDDMAELRALLGDEKILRMEREWMHQDKVAGLRAEYASDIRRLESDRLDKIRTVDVANAAATAAQLLGAVTTLATTQQVTAETLRNQVAATATAVASQTERIINPIIERITLLERALASTAGKSEGVSDSGKLLILILTLITALMGFYTFTQRGNAGAPQVIYAAPPGTVTVPPPTVAR